MNCLSYQIYLVVMALAFFGAVAFGVYANYSFMKRIAEGSLPMTVQSTECKERRP